MDYTQILFYCILLLVAFLYASVGHGGASGYLALMALFGMSAVVMRPTALVLNLFVAGVSFFQYYRANHFKKDICWPLLVTSVPMAYLGMQINLQDGIYKKILGVVLLFSVARFLLPEKWGSGKVRPANRTALFVIGGTIGFLSGMIGIGGGIILSPILLLLHWTNQKQTAAISAVFILANSISGLIGMIHKDVAFTSSMYAYIGVAFAGGLAGAYLGARKFNQTVLKFLLVSVLLIAIYHLLFKS